MNAEKRAIEALKAESTIKETEKYKLVYNINGFFIYPHTCPQVPVRFRTEKRAVEVFDLLIQGELTFHVRHRNSRVDPKISIGTGDNCVSYLPYDQKIETISESLRRS